MEPSSAYAGLAACVVGIGLGIAAPLREPKAERERAAGIALERIATVGDYPLLGLRVVVNLDVEGRITFEGRRVKYEALVPALLPVVGRAGHAPDGTSTLTAVLRVDRSVPWCACAWI